MLINCIVYQNGKRLADIPVENISNYVDKPDCFVWVALHNASDEELATMQDEFGLHDLAVEDASRGHQRPKVEEYGETLSWSCTCWSSTPRAKSALAKCTSSSDVTSCSRYANAAARACWECTSVPNASLTCFAMVQVLCCARRAGNSAG